MSERKMDPVSEKVWWAGREDRTRKDFNRNRYRENWEKIFGKKKEPENNRSELSGTSKS